MGEQEVNARLYPLCFCHIPALSPLSCQWHEVAADLGPKLLEHFQNALSICFSVPQAPGWTGLYFWDYSIGSCRWNDFPGWTEGQKKSPPTPPLEEREKTSHDCHPLSTPVTPDPLPSLDWRDTRENPQILVSSSEATALDWSVKWTNLFFQCKSESLTLRKPTFSLLPQLVYNESLSLSPPACLSYQLIYFSNCKSYMHQSKAKESFYEL